MSKKRRLRYAFGLILALLLHTGFVEAQTGKLNRTEPVPAPKDTSKSRKRVLDLPVSDSIGVKKTDTVFVRQDSLKSKKPDSLKVKVKPVKVPTRFRLGVDLARPLISLSNADYSGSEISFESNIHRIVLSLDAGNPGRIVTTNNYSIQSSGRFVRLGFGKNVFESNQKFLFFGMAAGFTNGTYTLNKATIQDTLFSSEVVFSDPIKRNFSGSWIEATGGLKVSLFKNVMLGFTIRAKYKMRLSDEASYPVSYLSGFGLTKYRTFMGFNYYLIYDFGFPNKPKKPIKK